MTTPEGGQSATTDGQSAAGTGTTTVTDPQAPTGQSAGAATGTGTTPEPEPTVSRKDFEAIRTQLSAADKARQDAQAALKAIQDKDLPELDKLKRDYAEVTKARDDAVTQLGQVRMENAFLRDNTKTWKKPDTALKLLDLSKVTIDSDGNVIGMKDAIEALAKSDPYLLADKTPETETPPAGPGGTITGTNGRGTAGQTGKQMVGRFPAMRSRGITPS